MTIIILASACHSGEHPQTASTADTGGATRVAASAGNLAAIQGTWVSAEDSEAQVDISDLQWIFRYAGAAPDAMDTYQIKFTDSVTSNQIKSSYLTLSNESDTLKYSIDLLSADTLRLIYLPRGNTLVYIRTK